MEIDYGAIILQIEEKFPNIPWDAVFEADKALNWELWHGTLPDNYWTYVEPLDHYVWQGFEQACHDLQGMLSDLPGEIWYDYDCDAVVFSDPNDDEDNWEEEDGEYHWIGGEWWMKLDPREVILLEETWKQVF